MLFLRGIATGEASAGSSRELQLSQIKPCPLAAGADLSANLITRQPRSL